MLKGSDDQEGKLAYEKQRWKLQKGVVAQIAKNVGERVKKYIREILYLELKICEHDHIDTIYGNLMEQEDMVKPNRIDDDELKKNIKTKIK